MSNEELAKKIVDLLGGKDNILNAENCMTRIRVKVKDGSKADRQGIKNTPGHHCHRTRRSGRGGR